MSHYITEIKYLYTPLECAVLPCLEIAADLIPGSTKAVDKIKQILFSDTTVERR